MNNKNETFFSLFSRDKKVCPYYMIHSFDNIFRKLIHNPQKILNAYIKKGNTVADIGCGIGYFSIPMAKMVGEKGKVYAIDIQEKMLEGVKKRAISANLLNRIIFHQVNGLNMDLNQIFDFILNFWMVHEVPDTQKYLQQIFNLLKPNSKYFLVEPKMHVKNKRFNEIKNLCLDIGFKEIDSPDIFFSRSVLFSK